MICGRAMVLHVIDALERLHPARTALVVGHGAEQVTKKVQDLAPAWANVVFVEQPDQRGTGDAAAIGMTAFPGDDLDDDSTIVVLPGDTPLLLPETLDELVATHVANGSAATLLTSVVDDPTGYGRVVTGAGRPGAAHRRAARRVARGAGRSTRSPRASTPSAATCSGRRCATCRPTTSQGEFYLTDVVGVLAGMGHRVGSRAGAGRGDPGRQRPLAAGAAPSASCGSRTNRHWLLNGVTMLDPRQTFIDVTVRLGRDVTLYPGTILEGNTVVGDGSEIGPTPASTTASSGRDCRIQHTVGPRPRSATAPASGRTATCRPGSHVAEGDADRRLLHCSRRTSDGSRGA